MPNRYRMTYTPIGELIVAAAKKRGLSVQAACALLQKESLGLHIFGGDWGTEFVDRVPFNHLPVTRLRLVTLLAGVRAGRWKSNGVGEGQLTWPGFLEDCERLHPDGAADVQTNLEYSFGLLVGYLKKYPEAEAWGAYNRGESGRADATGRAYARDCMRFRDEWAKRLK